MSECTCNKFEMIDEGDTFYMLQEGSTPVIVDPMPISGSSNLVSSGGIYTAIEDATEIDPTLSVSGMAADALSTGSIKSDVNNRFGVVDEVCTATKTTVSWLNATCHNHVYLFNGNKTTTGANYLRLTGAFTAAAQQSAAAAWERTLLLKRGVYKFSANIIKGINTFTASNDNIYVYDTGHTNPVAQFRFDSTTTYIISEDTNLLLVYAIHGTGNFSGFAFEIVIEDLSAPSLYQGKTLSILGDSISTFAGYIQEGNATYYPRDTVTNVADTWWYKLLCCLGMTLEVNNSWSGSRVTTTGGEAQAGCMTRCQSLGDNPDVIIVWMGINDFNNEVQLGTYDGTTSIPSVTTTFREAYGIMLNKILTTYQQSEVYVCTLPQCERNSSEGFPEINTNGVALAEFNKAIVELANAFGVKILDHNKCGLTYQNMPIYNPDNLHPNKDGHTLVALNDVKTLDSYLRINKLRFIG